MNDLAITDVETYLVANPWKPWVFVRVETNDGIHGLAEATTHDKPYTVAAAIEEMSDYFVGENPFDTEKLWLEMYRDEWFSKNVINTTVISAIDIACWDIKGKVLDRPVYDLLGGKVHGDRLRTYANGWYTETTEDLDTWKDAAEQVVADGYDAMKFDPFGNPWQRVSRKEFNHSVDVVGADRVQTGRGKRVRGRVGAGRVDPRPVGARPSSVGAERRATVRVHSPARTRCRTPGRHTSPRQSLPRVR